MFAETTFSTAYRIDGWRPPLIGNPSDSEQLERAYDCSRIVLIVRRLCDEEITLEEAFTFWRWVGRYGHGIDIWCDLPNIESRVGDWFALWDERDRPETHG